MAQLKYIDAICFEVCGEPKPKQRPRFSRRSRRAYTPAETKQYERRIKDAFRQSGHEAFPEEIPLSVSIIFGLKMPKSASKKRREKMLNGDILPMKVPDIDNLIKAVMDALNGLAYADDKQVVQVWAFKKYAEVPHTTILIQEAKFLIQEATYVRHHEPE